MSPSAGTLRVGLFGGAFDPPHQAHVALARAAIDQLGLAQLRILPTGRAWHKARALSPAEHRLAMATLAFAGLPQVRIDERELQRVGPTYTIETLKALAEELPGAEFHLLMGADQWAAFDTWRRWQDIAALARICVLARPGAPAPLPKPGMPVPQVLNLPPMDCSATAIREALAAGGAPGDLARLLPEAVARYISSHGLYGHPLPGATAPTS